MRIARTQSAFTLVELLVVVAIIGLLLTILVPALGKARELARGAVCSSNLHQLALANATYTNDHGGHYAPAALDLFNDLGDGRGGHWRWHGYRGAAGEAFDPDRGPLAEALAGGAVKRCPSFEPDGGVDAFESGNGGYGYNHSYIGGRADVHGFDAAAMRQTAKIGQVGRPAETVMFADAAFLDKSSGMLKRIEYSFTEPPYMQLTPGEPSDWRPDPSIAFRHADRTNVVWADGHVDAEPMAFSHAYLSNGAPPKDEVMAAGIGWFGADDNSLFDLN